MTDMPETVRRFGDVGDQQLPHRLPFIGRRRTACRMRDRRLGRHRWFAKSTPGHQPYRREVDDARTMLWPLHAKYSDRSWRDG